MRGKEKERFLERITPRSLTHATACNHVLHGCQHLGFPYRNDPRYHVGQHTSIGLHVRKTCKHLRRVFYLSITFTLYSIELERDTLVSVFDSRDVDVRGVQRIYIYISRASFR